MKQSPSNMDDKTKTKPTLDLDLVRKRGPTIGYISELSKKDPKTLTTSEQKILKDTQEQINKVIKPMLPGIVKTAEELRKSFANIKIPSLDLPRSVIETRNPLSEIRIPVTRPPANAIEQAKQTFILERLTQAIEDQGRDKYAEFKNVISPHYDPKKKELIFANRVIDVSQGKDYDLLCKAMFRKGSPRSTPVQFGDLLEKLGYDTKDTKRIRNLVNNFNNFIGKHTLVDDLFYARQKEVYFNSKYI